MTVIVYAPLQVNEKLLLVLRFIKYASQAAPSRHRQKVSKILASAPTAGVLPSKNAMEVSVFFFHQSWKDRYAAREPLEFCPALLASQVAARRPGVLCTSDTASCDSVPSTDNERRGHTPLSIWPAQEVGRDRLRRYHAPPILPVLGEPHKTHLVQEVPGCVPIVLATLVVTASIAKVLLAVVHPDSCPL